MERAGTGWSSPLCGQVQITALCAGRRGPPPPQVRHVRMSQGLSSCCPKTWTILVSGREPILQPRVTELIYGSHTPQYANPVSIFQKSHKPSRSIVRHVKDCGSDDEHRPCPHNQLD